MRCFQKRGLPKKVQHGQILYLNAITKSESQSIQYPTSI